MKKPARLASLFITAIIISTFGAGFMPSSLVRADQHTSPPYLLLGSSNYPPFEYLEYGKPQGLVADLIAEIAKDARLEIIIQNMKRSLAQKMVLAKTGIGHPFMASTPEREKKYDFTKKLVDLEFVMFVNKNATWAKNMANFSQRRIGVTKDSLPDQVIKYEFPDMQRVFFNNDLDGFGKLIKGEIDAFATGRLPGLFVLQKHGAESIVPIAENLAVKGLGIALLKGNTELLRKLDASIERLNRSGRLAGIKQSWLAQYSNGTESLWSALPMQLAGGFLVLIAGLYLFLRRNRKLNN